jgi:hypothetical protein
MSRYVKELGEVGNIEHLFDIPVNYSGPRFQDSGLSCTLS